MRISSFDNMYTKHINSYMSIMNNLQSLLLFQYDGKCSFPILMIGGCVPMCMSAYHRMFNGTVRVPRHGEDEIVQYADPTHIVVMSGGHAYAVDVVKRCVYLICANVEWFFCYMREGEGTCLIYVLLYILLLWVIVVKWCVYWIYADVDFLLVKEMSDICAIA